MDRLILFWKEIPSRYFLQGACAAEEIYCESSRIGPYFPEFSLSRTTIRLKIEKICPRFSTFSLRSLLSRRLLVRPHLCCETPIFVQDVQVAIQIHRRSQARAAVEEAEIDKIDSVSIFQGSFHSEREPCETQ